MNKLLLTSLVYSAAVPKVKRDQMWELRQAKDSYDKALRGLQKLEEDYESVDFDQRLFEKCADLSQ